MKIFAFIMLAILVLFFAAVAVVMFSKIRIIMSFSKEKGKEPAGGLRISLLGGLCNKDITSESFKKKKKTKTETGQARNEDEAFSHKARKYYNTFRDFKAVYSKNSHKIRKSVLIEKLKLWLEFGVGDAAKTGMLTGCIWSAIYDVIAFVASIVRVTEPEISISPDFEQSTFSAGGECIISARVANLMIVVVSIGITYLKYKKQKSKGGE